MTNCDSKYESLFVNFYNKAHQSVCSEVYSEDLNVASTSGLHTCSGVHFQPETTAAPAWAMALSHTLSAIFNVDQQILKTVLCFLKR